ncbi:MAG: GNAT family N-acetyltransferase [Promicromonosporaceae bacterium]|nr:GNAT family N-acetyltransferase [Promicromonosporaceae bacterium]
MNKTWPVTLRAQVGSDVVVLRPLGRRDANNWLRLRSVNHAWLEPWEATKPKPTEGTVVFGDYVRSLRKQARRGASLPFAIEHNSALVGQLTVSSISRGSLWSATMGYWVGRQTAGRGVAPTAVAMAADHCFTTLGLHRMEINIRPENERSLRVVQKLGFRDEGIRERYLHIDGEWRDHQSFALTAEEVPEGVLARWLATRRETR